MTDTDNLSRRRFLQATGGAASAVALAGCTGTDDNDSEGENENQEQTGGELNLINSTVTTLDPIKSTDTAGGRVIQNVFDALMNYPNGEVEVENLLLDDWEVSDDGTSYTLHLKEGVQYHGDHGEVTAQDVVYSWRRLAESKNSRRHYFILDFVGVTHETTTITYENEEGEEEEATAAVPDTLGLEATDDHTVEMEIDEPFHAVFELLAYTSFSVIPEGLVGDIEGYDGEMDHSEFATENPVGAGPFEFDTWESDNQVRITRFDDYHGETANVDAVHWNIMSDQDAKYTYGIQNQNADMVVNTEIPTSHYDPEKVSVEETDDLGRDVGTYGPTASDATMNYTAFATINAFYMGFNTDVVDKPIRKAVAYALNQQEAVEQVFKGRGEKSYHFTPPSIYPGGATEYTSHAEENYPYGYDESQLDKAEEVLQEAGYDSDNPASFTFTVYESSDEWADLGKLLRDKLQSVNVEMEIERAPFSTLLQRGRNGELEAYSLGWVMDWPAPDNFLQLLNPPQTDTSKSGPVSYINWSGTDAAEQATQAWEKVQNNSGPTDEEKQAREEAYVQIEEANWEDVGFLPTYHRKEERFKYEWVDCPRFGGGSTSRQKYNSVSLSEE
jgi:peptide/nickel transport system substrate-binding protein